MDVVWYGGGKVVVVVLGGMRAVVERILVHCVGRRKVMKVEEALWPLRPPCKWRSSFSFLGHPYCLIIAQGPPPPPPLHPSLMLLQHAHHQVSLCVSLSHSFLYEFERFETLFRIFIEYKLQI